MRLSAIGDTCHALAVVRNLMDNWPDAHITWVIGKTEATLLSDVEGVEFIIFDKQKGLGAIRDVRRALHRRRFDAALCMHASARVNLLYPFIRSDLKIGFDRNRARDFQWLFTNRQVEATDGKHALEAMLSFASAIGAEDKPLRWDIPVADADNAFAAQFREPGKPLVIISPCSSQRSRNFRNWSIDNFIAIVDYLAEQHDARVLISGGNSAIEDEYAQAICNACSNATDLHGKTSLKQLLALLREADVLICPDSGPAHMATAVGTAVVGLYATSNPARTGPYLSQQHTVNCYPLAARQLLHKSVDELRWGQRIRAPEAMELIKFSDVAEKVDEILQ